MSYDGTCGDIGCELCKAYARTVRADRKMTVGTIVEWTSQAGGSRTTKRGTICAVIPARAFVRDHLSGLQRIFAKEFSVLSRPHESYVVHVQSKTGKGVGKLYWPNVKNLREVGAQ